MANTINKASSAALHTTVQNYYDGKLLMEMENADLSENVE